MMDILPTRRVITRVDVQYVRNLVESEQAARKELSEFAESIGDETIRMMPIQWADKHELKLRREGKWADETA